MGEGMGRLIAGAQGVGIEPGLDLADRPTDLVGGLRRYAPLQVSAQIPAYSAAAVRPLPRNRRAASRRNS